MDSTRTSLLLRLKDPHDAAAWEEFATLYAPLLYAYGRARGLQHDDAEDVRATCYETLVRQMPGFAYDKARGGFKAWLHTLVQRRVADLLRRRQEQVADSHALAQVPDSAPGPDEVWEQAWRRQHLQYCLAKVRQRVSEQTYAAFQLLLDDVCGVPEICTRLGMNTNQVYKAKARVVELVREEMTLLDPDAAA